MTRTQAIGHVLRRLWFWPLIFWIRPLDVAGRLRERLSLELITAILGSGVWGALAGVALWLRTDDLQAIWVLSLAVAVVGAVPGAVAGAGAVTGAGAAAGMLGIALGVWLPASVLIYLLVPIATVIVFSSFKLAWDERTGHETAGWILYTWTIAFRWQSFAYPLPGLGSYLTRLGRNAGPAAALGAIQSAQFDTLQYAAARRAGSASWRPIQLPPSPSAGRWRWRPISRP